MEDFEKFKNNILGKIYRRKIDPKNVYVIVDVCGAKNNSNLNSDITFAHVIYLCISVPDGRITTGFYSDNDSIKIQHHSIDLTENLNSHNESYCLCDNITLDDVIDYYKIVNANIKDLLRGIGAKF